MDEAEQIYQDARARLPHVYDLLTQGDDVQGAQLVFEMVKPSTLHIHVTCCTMANLAAQRLREVLPAGAAEYYAFTALDSDTGENIEIDDPGIAWASRFFTSACNGDDALSHALLTAMTGTGDPDYVMDCVIGLLLQTWHILTSPAEYTHIDAGPLGRRPGITLERTSIPEEP